MNRDFHYLIIFIIVCCCNNVFAHDSTLISFNMEDQFKQEHKDTDFFVKIQDITSGRFRSFWGIKM